MNKVTSEHKAEVLAAIGEEAKKLGSFSKVAVKCGVAVATITENMKRPDKQYLVKDEMWIKVGKALGVKFGSKWNVVEITNYKMMREVMNMAQTSRRWIPVAAKSGSGKSASIGKYTSEVDDVYVLECGEWSRRNFLLRLAQMAGVNLQGNGYLNMDVIGEKIVEFFKQRGAVGYPLLILDEAHDLRPAALRWLKVLYNSLKGELGVVICGTENLKKEIKAGVNRAVKGYDEIDSRFGRMYIELPGATKDDVAAICIANGLDKKEAIEAVWKESGAVQRMFRGTYVTVVEDLRRLESIIVRETIFNNF